MKFSIVKRFMAIVIAIVLVMGLSACGNETVTSEYWVWEDEDVQVDGDINSEQQDDSGSSSATKKPSASNNNSSANNSSSKNNSSANNSSSKNNSSVNNSSSKKPTANKDTDSWDEYRVKVGTVGANGKDYSNYNPYEGIEKYKGTTVKFATWMDPSKDIYSNVSKDFYEKYGIKLEYVYCSQDAYAQEVLSLIAANNAPDIIFENDFFPSSLQLVQPITVSGIDLNAPNWDQNTIKALSYNGKCYFVNAINSPDVMSSAITVFNKDLLESNGIKTPEEYYKEGKWTISNLKKICQQVCALGSEYKGAYFDSTYSPVVFGGSLVSFDGKKFTNTYLSKKFTSAMKFKAEMTQLNYAYTDSADFTSGKGAIMITDNSPLKVTGYTRNMDPDSLGYTYLPKADDNSTQVFASMTRGYGISKGSKNPVAAGYAICYMTDGNNFNLKDVFVNKDAAAFNYNLVSNVNKGKMVVCYEGGVAKVTGTWAGYWRDVPANPDQVEVFMQSQNNKVQNAIDKSNELLGKTK